ncbi:hypothetical protein IL306_008954 [Fusarium sp. DS 682]|nr:hypothetical protein IL306_008954 [Fusarium sp. DS 682]
MLTVESRSLLKIYGVPGIVVEQAEKKGDLLVKNFLDGMRVCDTLKVFQDGMPRFKDIWNKCKPVSETSSFKVDRAGTYFYLLMYFNEKTNDCGVYLGRTKDLDARYTQHSGALRTEKLTLLHYRMARELLKDGATYRLFPLLFTPDVHNANIFDGWVETILMVLFESFNPVMLGCRRHLPSNEKVDEIPDWGRSAQQDGYLRTYTRPLALMILDIGSQMKNATPSLQKFKLQDTFTGLNWCVPLAEGHRYEASLWIRTTTPATDTEPAMWSFRTLPKRLTSINGIAVFYGNRRTTQPVRFRHTVPVEGTPLGPGSTVNIVVEITKDPNTRHTHSYLSVPIVGPLDCWTEAFRVGIKIEYEDNGKWYMMYLRQNRMTMFSTTYGSVIPDDLGKSIEKIDTTWIHMIKIMAALLNWRWQPENSLTKHIYVPYLNRTRTMDPKLLTLDETSDLIEEKHGLDVHIGHIPGPRLFLPPSASEDRFIKCDLCKSAPDSSLSPRCKERVVVDTINGQDLLQCPFSAAFGRYCTFTEDIQNREDLRDLVYIRIRDYPVQNMDEPPNMFQYLEMRDSTAGEGVEKDGGDG